MSDSSCVLSRGEQPKVIDDSLDTSCTRKVVWLIAASTVVRLLLGEMLGLTYDETYIAVMSHHLGWGYVDHPPAAMALSALAQALTGSSSNLALRLPAIVLFAGTTWMTYLTGRILFGARPGWYAAFLLTFMPLSGLYLGVHGVTDAPMLFCLAATALCLSRALFCERRRWTYWISAGAFAGLSLSSKYTAVLALLGFAIFFLTSPKYRKLLATPAPYAATAVALLIFLPVLAWNWQHDWISLKFQGERIGATQIAPMALLNYLAAQSIFLMPGPGLLLILAMAKAFRLGPRSERTWFLVCAGSLPLVFFACLRLFSSNPTKGYHWAASGYLLLCPLAGWLAQDLLQRWPRLMRACTQILIVSVVILVSIVVIDTRTDWLWRAFPSLARHDPLLKDGVDWADLTPRLEQAEREQAVVAGLEWEECVKADWAMRGKLPVLCLTRKPLQYALFRPQSDFIGRDAIIFTRLRPEALVELSERYFDAIKILETAVLTDFGRPFSDVTIARGIRFKGRYPWPYESKSGVAQP